ncbi:hypothetical protein PS413_09625, partial [Limosilactobacillus fermentum]
LQFTSLIILNQSLYLTCTLFILGPKDLQGKWISHKINIKFVPYINNLYVRDADITIATSWLTSYAIGFII